ncbi:MAG: hypothetical protein ChlgKO_10500 [Chlamydiales bacterium]
MANAFQTERELERFQNNSLKLSLEKLLKITPQNDSQKELHGKLLHQAVEQSNLEYSKELFERAATATQSDQVKKLLEEIANFEDAVAPHATMRRDLEAAKKKLRKFPKICCEYSDKAQNIPPLSLNLHTGLEMKDQAEMAFYLYEMAGVLLLSGDKEQFFSLYRGLPQNIKEAFNILTHNMGACLNEFSITVDLTLAYTFSRKLAEAAIRVGYFVANGDDLGDSASEEVSRMERELPEYMEATADSDIIQAQFA